MWTLQDAKAKFSAVVDAAMAGTPQAVSRRGQPAVVIVAADEWARVLDASRAAGLRGHLTAIPTRGQTRPIEVEIAPRATPL